MPLDRANPFQCALRAGLDSDATGALERLEPVRWPDGTRGEAPRSARRAIATAAVAGAVAGEAGEIEEIEA